MKMRFRIRTLMILIALSCIPVLPFAWYRGSEKEAIGFIAIVFFIVYLGVIYLLWIGCLAYVFIWLVKDGIRAVSRWNPERQAVDAEAKCNGVENANAPSVDR